MAKETNSEIIPIAIEQYNQTFYFNIGKNYTIDKNTSKSVEELRDDLRGKLATLKWEIMEREPFLKRKDIPKNYLQEFQEKIVNRCNYGYGFSLQDAINESFHDKLVVDSKEVYDFLNTLEIGKHNAFLMKNQIELQRKK